MPWQEYRFLRGSNSHLSDVWRLSIADSGARLTIPLGHPLAAAPAVRIFFGDGADAGWMRLLPAELAVGVRKISRSRHGRVFLAFKAFPGLPSPSYRLEPTALEARPDANGVALRLPWAAAPKLSDAPTDNLIGPIVTSLAPSTARPVEHDTDADLVRDFASRSSTAVMSLEQAAEYVRGMGRRCTVQERKPVRAPNGKLIPVSVVILDGKEVAVGELFRVMNAYRSLRELPPIRSPAA